MTQQQHPASIAACLSSEHVFRCNLLSPVPSDCLPRLTVVLALGLLSSAYTPAPSCCTFQWSCIPCLGYTGLWHRLCSSLSMQIVTDQLLHPPTASDAAPSSQLIGQMWRSQSRFSSPTSWVQVQSAHSSPLFPFLSSSYQVLRESIDSFLVVRDSCQFSAGSLGGLLHLKASMKRDTLYIHPLTRHLVSSPHIFLDYVSFHLPCLMLPSFESVVYFTQLTQCFGFDGVSVMS